MTTVTATNSPRYLQVEFAGPPSAAAMLAALYSALPEQARRLRVAYWNLKKDHHGQYLASEATDVPIISSEQAKQTWPQSFHPLFWNLVSSSLEDVNRNYVETISEWEAIALIFEMVSDFRLICLPLSMPSWPQGKSSSELELFKKLKLPLKPGAMPERFSSSLLLLTLGLLSGNGGLPSSLNVDCIGYGSLAQNRESRARVIVAHDAEEKTDDIAVLEANIDDQNPEIYEVCFHKLLAAGALDVSLQPVIMKKQRPGLILSVLCKPSQAGFLAEIMLRETSTLGVRKSLSTRYTLQRESLELSVLGEPIRVKLAYHGGQLMNIAPEYDDCRKVAEKTNTPLKMIYQQAIAAFWLRQNTEE